MNLIIIFIIIYFLRHSTCYIGCKFEFSNNEPVVGPYSCELQVNETVDNIDAFNLKGCHLESMSDYDIHYVAIKSVKIHKMPGNFFIRFVNAKNFACINTTVSDLTYSTFVNASNLEYAWIYDNNITKIEQGFLKDASESLKMLVLSRNGIKKLDKHAIGNMSSLQDLYLDGNFLKSIVNNTFTGLSSLFTLSLARNMIELLEPNAFSGLATLTTLYLDNNKISELDKNVLKPLKRLSGLSLNYNYLSHLDKELFVHFERLGYLELSSNRLKFISFLEVLSNLEFLDITNNQVDAIKKFERESLPKFQKLNATGNLCINKNFNSNITQGLNECFENYRIPSCKYHSHPHFGYMCVVLNRFDMDDNLPISVTYDDINYLKVMDITKNFSFSMLTQKFPKLYKILVKKSSLKHVLEQDFDCKETRIIDVRMNKLINLRGGIFIDCTKLQQLILIKDQIPSLPVDFFLGLDNIKFIDLSFNLLKNEDLDMINQNFMKLTKLYLSGNRFTFIYETLFLFMGNLRVLKLDSNKITQIGEHAFVNLRNLEELHLQFNGISDTSFLNDLVKLTYLNLEENRIKMISGNFPKKLQYIDMSFNQIESIELSVIREMKNLNDLVLIKNACIDDHINDIKLLSKNITQLLNSCTIK